MVGVLMKLKLSIGLGKLARRRFDEISQPHLNLLSYIKSRRKSTK
jgi:hypothetical protein